MKPNRIYLLALLPVLIALSTCSLPPYDEGLSLGLETAKKMVELGAIHETIGPLQAWGFDFRDREFFYMPNKGSVVPDDFMSGFVVSYQESFLDVSYVEYILGPPEDFLFHSGWGVDITNDDPDRFNFHVETIKWGPFLSFIRFDAEDYWNNQYFRIEWNSGFNVPDVLGTGPFPPYPAGHLRSYIHSNVFASDPAKNPTVVGASIWPLSDIIGYDDQNFFCRFDGSGLFAEVQFQTDTGTGLSVPSIILDDLDFNFPDYLENAFYYHNGNLNFSYLSYYSQTQRKYKNYRWDASGLLTPLVDMDRRIDAALSNGNLLSFENNRCYVYDSDGDKLYSFLLGGLHFCYETYVGGVPHVVFSLGAWLDYRDQEEDELYFTVYIFPTDRLEELQ
jgi:hypothetical protein